MVKQLYTSIRIRKPGKNTVTKAQQIRVLLIPNEVSLQVPKQLLLNTAVQRDENITNIYPPLV